MTKLRNAIEFAPEFVGVTGQNAKRWAKTLLDQFDADAAGLSTEFDTDPGEDFEDRFDILRGLYMAKGADHPKVGFFIGLMILAGYSYAIHKGKTEYAEERDRLAGHLSTLEAKNPEMASVYSVADASTQTVWA